MANIVTRASLMGDPLNYFPNFLWKCWRTIGLPDPTALQYDFAAYLMEGLWDQLVAAAGEGDQYARRLILMAFRGASKSYVTTAFAVYLLRLNREELVLVTSATSGYAGGIATFAWQMVSNFDWLADLKPSNEQRRSAQAFDVAGCPPAVKDESFASESIFGQITGRRATRIIGDDLETPNTSETEGKRSQLRARMGELGGAIIKPGGSIYLLGTAQTEQTIYREYHEERGYELRIWPVVYPTPSDDPKKDELKKYGPLLAPSIRDALTENPALAGTSVEPSRFTEVDILQRQKEWGLVEFARQFKMFMDAGVGKGNPIHMRDLVVMELGKAPAVGCEFLLPSDITFSPTPAAKLDITVDALTGDSQVYGPLHVDGWIKPEAIFGSIDTSGEGSDETVWTIAAGLLGRVFILWQGSSLEGHTKDTMVRIAKDGKLWGCQSWQVESNFGQGMFAELLQPACADIGYEPEILSERAGQVSKERRIVDTFEPVVTTNRLIINAELLREDFDVDYEDVEAAKRRYYRLTYQLSRMTRMKGCVVHDDRADSGAMVVARFEGMLRRRLHDAQREGRMRAIEAEGEAMIAERKRQGLPLFGLEKLKRAFGRGGQGRKR
jgi:hypothetical protein